MVPAVLQALRPVLPPGLLEARRILLAVPEVLEPEAQGVRAEREPMLPEVPARRALLGLAMRMLRALRVLP